MKTILHSAAVTVALCLLGTLQAPAFFDPHIGRWASRDPVGEQREQNSHAHCQNDLITRVDMLGLWRVEHEILTTWSLNEALLRVNPLISSKCKQRILTTLIQGNVETDTQHLTENPLHYNRDRKTVASADISPKYLADTAYSTALTKRESSFYRYLKQMDAGGCYLALIELGSLTHSWQDFYAHAIRRDGQGGREASRYGGWVAWASTPSVTGDPRNRGNFWPSSFELLTDAGEHPGTGPEPLIKGSPEYMARYAAAQGYVQVQYTWFLPRWLSSCSCACETAKKFP